jgi:16S rRNA (cytosine967-C5)-methyltransferase
MGPARLEAFRILLRVETEQAYAANLLASRKLDALSSEDRGLVYELVLGVLRWQRQLDYFIQRYAQRPVSKLDVSVVLALRLGLYQIRFLERIPQWAAVNESVQLVKQQGVGSAAKLVNAVLRQACQRRQEVAGEDVRDEWERLSIELSHPRWLVEKWVRQFGRAEAIALMQANNTAPRPALRFNPGRGTLTEIRSQLEHEGVALEPSRYVSGAYIVTTGTLANQSPPVQLGQVYLQDEGSQLIASLLDAQPGMRVLDLCAAPGGKSSQIAVEMQDTGLIVAGDLHVHRLHLLQQTCQRLAVTIVHPLALDGTQSLPLLPGHPFDRVLVDAPCSGTGTIRRHPEIKWRLQPERLTPLAETQIKLLKSAAAVVAPGGWLVYSTCSLEPEENQAVVEGFLAEESSFKLQRPAIHEALLDTNGYVRTYPHRHDMDGFFAAVLIGQP